MPELKPITKKSYGDLIPLKEWLNEVDCGGFIDYDGWGYWATDKEFLDGWENNVSPSEVKNATKPVPEWATHVLWFNK